MTRNLFGITTRLVSTAEAVLGYRSGSGIPRTLLTELAVTHIFGMWPQQGRERGQAAPAETCGP
ncbi:MAG: hypothetical protein JXA69_05745, partial [Phycisphaerae bacterium]|nr:hypothetical protein [Phycisphaerae bacterium]